MKYEENKSVNIWWKIPNKTTIHRNQNRIFQEQISLIKTKKHNLTKLSKIYPENNKKGKNCCEN